MNNESPSSGTSSPALTDRASVVSACSSSRSRDVSAHHVPSHHVPAKQQTKPAKELTPDEPAKAKAEPPKKKKEEKREEVTSEEKTSIPRHRHRHHHHHHHKENAETPPPKRDDDNKSKGESDREQSPSSFLADQAAKLRPSREPIVLLRPIPEQQSLLISARGNLRKPGESGKPSSSNQSNVARQKSNRRVIADQLKKLKPRERSPVGASAPSPTAAKQQQQQQKQTSSSKPSEKAVEVKEQETMQSTMRNVSLKVKPGNNKKSPVTSPIKEGQGSVEKHEEKWHHNLKVIRHQNSAPSDEAAPAKKETKSIDIPKKKKSYQTDDNINKDLDDSSATFESAASSANFQSLDNLADKAKVVDEQQPFGTPPMQTSSLSQLHLVANRDAYSPGSSSLTVVPSRERAGSATHSSTSTITASPMSRKSSKNRRKGEGPAQSAADRVQHQHGTESSAMRLLRRLSGKNRHRNQVTVKQTSSTTKSDQTSSTQQMSSSSYQTQSSGSSSVISNSTTVKSNVTTSSTSRTTPVTSGGGSSARTGTTASNFNNGDPFQQQEPLPSDSNSQTNQSGLIRWLIGRVVK